MNNETIYPAAPTLTSQQRAKLRSLASTMPAVISTALEYIHTRYAEIDGLSDIAAHAGCSVT